MRAKVTENSARLVEAEVQVPMALAFRKKQIHCAGIEAECSVGQTISPRVAFVAIGYDGLNEITLATHREEIWIGHAKQIGKTTR